VLDGGLATQIEAGGTSLGEGSLWSARLLGSEEGCKLIGRAHGEFARAGAQVAITASYQASLDGFLRAGLVSSEREAAELISRSVRVARASCPASCTIAGSVGPFGAVLASGAEYTGEYSVTSSESRGGEELRRRLASVLGTEAGRRLAERGSLVSCAWLYDFHRFRIRALCSPASGEAHHRDCSRPAPADGKMMTLPADGGIDARPDCIAIETLPCAADGIAAVAALAEMGDAACPCWVSFSVRAEAPGGDIVLANGDGLAESVEAVLAAGWVSPGVNVVIGVGVNCCHPLIVHRSLGVVKGAVEEVYSHVTGAAASHSSTDAGPVLQERIRGWRTAPAHPCLVAYPNAGEGWDGTSREWVSTDAALDWEELVAGWIEQAGGLGLCVGGCCRTTPEMIARIRRVVDGTVPKHHE
jgi:homocysteine S-methyltransferase